VKNLRRNQGFKAYLVLNNDGVVLRWEQEGEQLAYQKAVQYSHHVLDLCNKSKAHIKDLFDPQDNQVESVRLRTDDYELIAAQEGKYTLVVIHEGCTVKSQTAKEEVPSES